MRSSYSVTASLVQHLPSVGQNFQDHAAVGCIWEYKKPLAPRNNAGEATFFWKSDPRLDTPDIQTCQAEVPLTSAEILTRFSPPAGSWTMFGGLIRPKSRGRIRLTGPDPIDAVQIETAIMSHPDDLKAAIACVQLCREIGNSAALRPFTKREVMPGHLQGAALENFVRDRPTPGSPSRLREDDGWEGALSNGAGHEQRRE